MQQQYKCPRCGAPVNFGVGFCSGCGTQLNWPTQQPGQYYQQQSEPPKKHKLGIILLGIILCLAAVGSCVVCVMQPGTSSVSNSTPPSDQAYQASVNAIVDRFYNHRKEYNTGIERVGEKVRSAETESEQREAIQQAITHLKNSREWFRQDMNDFAGILPPSKFQEFHLLINTVMRDYMAAMDGFITYYSQNLNLGTQDLELANRASAYLRTANENLQRAAYMYAQLTGAK